MTAKLDPPASALQGIVNGFVKQFYNMLLREPTEAYKFYQDSSALSRPGPNGAMKSVTGVKEINELILSLDYQSYEPEISFVDVQISCANGLLVLVTGCLIGKKNLRRKFTQSFFLAPQQKSYYVLNDVFRYVDDKEPTDVINNDVGENTETASSLEPEVTHLPKNAVANHTTVSDNGDNSGNEASHPLDSGMVSVLENEVVPEQPVSSSEKSQNASPGIQDDAPKRTYASIVHDLMKNSAPFRAPPPKTKPVEQSHTAPAPEAPAPKSNSTLERKNGFSGKNTSIFVANLPSNATEAMLSEVFKKFGPIKPNGVRVRCSKESNNCFGFVDFESAVSLQKAVKASHIKIGNRQANIEEKRGGSNGGRPGRGDHKDENGHRNNNFNSNDNFNSGRNFGRNRRSEFSGGQAWGSSGLNGERDLQLAMVRRNGRV